MLVFKSAIYARVCSAANTYIPISGMAMVRRDLLAAAKLLIAMHKSFSQFQFDTHHGGLWDKDKQRLYVPLPGWREDIPFSGLVALKPFVESLGNLGYVKEICLIFLNDRDDQADVCLRRNMKTQFQSLMPIMHFALCGGISVVELEDLGGD